LMKVSPNPSTDKFFRRLPDIVQPRQAYQRLTTEFNNPATSLKSYLVQPVAGTVLD